MTFLGSAWFLAPITILAVALLTLTRRFAMACLVAAAMTTSLVLTVTIKTTVGRGRPDPDDVVGAINTGFAFPSGHTLNSTVFLGLTAVLLLTVIRARRARLLLLVTAVALAASIGLSRIYLGYHWLSDVLAGWASGVAVLGLCWMLAAWWRGGLQPFGRESTRVGHTGPHA